MVTPTPPPPVPVAAFISGLLDRGYTQTVAPVLTGLDRSLNTGLMRQRRRDLEAEAERLDEAGERLTADNPILRAFTADLADTLRADAILIDTAAEPLQAAAIDSAGVIQRRLALGSATDQQLARIGVAWNTPDPEAVAQLIQIAQSPAWSASLQKFGPNVLDVVNNQALRAVALGRGPIAAAREITRLVDTFPRHQANNLLRTLQMTSYRRSTAVHQQANLAIASQVVRIAARDVRTCLSCLAEDGKVLWDSERDASAPVQAVQDHHSGRCGSVLIVKGRAYSRDAGPAWFASLPPERQQQQLSFVKSPGKFAAYRDGRAALADFVHPYEDDTFGPMLREASLKGILSNV